jgi:catechol 2,3-dioxygenase-like lactoylglutathione lyase family enzyme
MAGQVLYSIAGFRLVTADLPRLTRFYADVLGFAADGPPAPIGVDEIAMLELSGGGQRQVLRLGAQAVALEAFDVPGAPYPAQGNAASLRFQHLALVVDDIAAAHARLRGGRAITDGGPQHLPPSSGGVSAFKFRDPDGHPLELLQFPAKDTPPAWRGKRAPAGQIGLGIDHSAISVSDVDASAAFYAGLGLAPGKRSHNKGAEQQRLDDLRGVQVVVAPLQPSRMPPHLELLCYQVPRGEAGPPLRANDVAATRVAWRGDRPALLRDPDGHLHQIET